jgi:hypothetical protein
MQQSEAPVERDGHRPQQDGDRKQHERAEHDEQPEQRRKHATPKHGARCNAHGAAAPAETLSGVGAYRPRIHGQRRNLIAES